MAMSKISICFAVYQNEGALAPLYERVTRELKSNFSQHTYELLFVNDGSTDNSLPELLKLRERDTHVRVLSFSRNFGQMAAILAGWENSRGDCVINMAADLQDPPEQCAKMIQEWEEGSEIVISYRESHATSLSRRITSRLFYRALLPNVPPGGFDFTLIDRKAMDVINSLKEKNRFYQYDILWAGFKTKYIPYSKLKREIGKSQYDAFKRFKNFYSAFLNVSYLPIRLLAVIGMLFSGSGFLYALTILWAYTTQKTPFPGWAPLMIMLLLIGGLIMLMLGILGEYIWRILDEVKHRPNYVIAKRFE